MISSPPGPPIRIFAFDPDGMSDACAERLHAILDPEERARWARFRPPATRRLFLAAHGLLRVALSLHGGGGPSDWRFLRTASGRPFLDPERHSGGLGFNLSHTRSLVICAVSDRFELGVDVEWHDPGADLLLLAGQVLAGPERRWWLDLEPEARTRPFFRLWTLKEALLKATGLGLGCPPAGICFDPEDLAAVVAVPQEIGSPGDWSFQSFEPTPDHAFALAVRSPVLPAWSFTWVEDADLLGWAVSSFGR